MPDVKYGFTPILEMGQQDSSEPFKDFCITYNSLETDAAIVEFTIFQELVNGGLETIQNVKEKLECTYFPAMYKENVQYPVLIASNKTQQIFT